MTRPPYYRSPRGGGSDRNDPRRRGRPRGASRSSSPRSAYAPPPAPGAPSGGGGGLGGMNLNTGSLAVLAGVLVVGVGIGSLITSTTQGGQGNIASQQQLDMEVPDPEFCRLWGASAFVIDVEMYTTLNPSTSFVTQPALQPGCVIRRENWSVLKREGAITNEDERECKQRMNTFAYIGSIRDKPIVKCVYQTDLKDNKFYLKGVSEDAGAVGREAYQF
ncbi:DUF3172 domain-containing protein [Prochlorococcus sp. MIT 1300]|uniref:DUF3172 domain-containing protein n=1 Tax=Prochlorococcus sp. MIT 1300 TaxID=3096218 RepID=UPI002A74D123|nr:DUF3172 domain-containing protein [Prochlorococcus sp. MIT 1300]